MGAIANPLPLRVTALTRYGRQGASSRVRMYQYEEALGRAGIVLQVQPFLDDNYVEALRRGQRRMSAVLNAYLRRVTTMLRRVPCDLLWVEKECFPWLPASFERLMLGAKMPVVLDYDDAVFHQYDQHRFAAVRSLLGDKLTYLQRRASLVLAGNQYLADYAEQNGACRVEILPSVIDLDRYSVSPPVPTDAATNLPVVGWIGQRSTAGYLSIVAPLAREFAARGRARFIALGGPPELLDEPFEAAAWNEREEVQRLRQFSIGIMPLRDGLFERGKCGYKLIQYMACGLPVVASSVGVNRTIVEHGVNGFLADTPAEWKQALEQLLASPALRMQMGMAGRRKVESLYSVQANAPRIAAWFHDVASRQEP